MSSFTATYTSIVIFIKLSEIVSQDVIRWLPQIVCVIFCGDEKIIEKGIVLQD